MFGKETRRGSVLLLVLSFSLSTSLSPSLSPSRPSALLPSLLLYSVQVTPRLCNADVCVGCHSPRQTQTGRVGGVCYTHIYIIMYTLYM